MRFSKQRARELFETIGAQDIDALAQSEVDADRPELARQLLLMGLRRAAGRQGLALLYEVCQLLDDSAHGIEDLQAKIPEQVEWRVCEVDANERPTGRVILDLHRVVGRWLAEDDARQTPVKVEPPQKSRTKRKPVKEKAARPKSGRRR